MKTWMNGIVAIPILVLFSCTGQERVSEEIRRTFPENLTVRVRNPLNAIRKDALVSLDVFELKQKISVFNEKACVVWEGGRECPSQLMGTNGPNDGGSIVFAADFAPKQTKRVTLCFRQGGETSRDYPKRTQAELSVKTGGKFVGKKYIGGKFQNVDFLRLPPEHTDHSEYIRYEGPGWESDRIGYRFYLDWRNATDIYGKKTTSMVLQDVGQDGFESYHVMADWGMDILKVGESLGIGSVGVWLGDRARRVAETDSVFCRIVAKGPVFSRIQTEYSGWSIGSEKVDLVSDLSIGAGSRLTMHELEVRGDLPNLCTGLVKHEAARLLKSERKGWSYLALWGKQSLAEDNLGMAVVFRNENLASITEDTQSHVVVLRPKDGHLTYGFLAAWEKEPEGIRTRDGFTAFLEKILDELDTPVQITY